jgi:hypothetical protein
VKDVRTAPKGAVDFEGLAVSLKRYPDTTLPDTPAGYPRALIRPLPDTPLDARRSRHEAIAGAAAAAEEKGGHRAAAVACGVSPESAPESSAPHWAGLDPVVPAGPGHFRSRRAARVVRLGPDRRRFHPRSPHQHCCYRRLRLWVVQPQVVRYPVAGR